MAVTVVCGIVLSVQRRDFQAGWEYFPLAFLFALALPCFLEAHWWLSSLVKTSLTQHCSRPKADSMSCNWNIKAPVTAQNEQTWLWLKRRRKKGWSGCFIRVKSDCIWPLYLAVPLCDLLSWAFDILRTRGGISNPSHYFRAGFLSRVTLESQGNSFKNKGVTDYCEEASLITAEVWACDVLHHSHPGAEVLGDESMPEKCPEHCRVSGMEWRTGVTCTSHYTGTLDLLSLIWKLDSCQS